MKLTRTILEREHAAIVAAGKGRKLIWDKGGVAGFGARVTVKHAAYILNYRAANRAERRLTIGTLGEATVETARKRAAEL
ncbi:MAG: integrase arm-type DNA-binding domain-containing protein, partial [Aestuariivirgaceae bacterium]